MCTRCGPSAWPNSKPCPGGATLISSMATRAACRFSRACLTPGSSPMRRRLCPPPKAGASTASPCSRGITDAWLRPRPTRSRAASWPSSSTGSRCLWPGRRWSCWTTHRGGAPISGRLAGAGAVRVLPAVVLAAPQHRRSSVAQAQVRVAAALDYADKETLRYRVWLALKDVG
jgi:hypothetical protein